MSVFLQLNDTYLGTFNAYGGDAQYSPSSPAEPGGPGTVFIYHEVEEHTTLYISNNGLKSHRLNTEGRLDIATEDHHVVDDYNDLSKDGFKAWILPSSGEHWLNDKEHYYK